MSTEVQPAPNIPPALRELVDQAVGAASVCWKQSEDERIFDARAALKVGDELAAHIERAFDAREAAFRAHLQNVHYNLGQLHPDAEGRVEAARRGVSNVIGLLERRR